MDAPFYLIDHANAFIIVDATDHKKYLFKIRDHKLYHVHNDSEWLVITHVIRHVFPFYKVNVLTAYEEDPKNRDGFQYNIDRKYCDDPKYDALFIDDYRGGLFLPSNPFEIYTDNTGTGVEKISIHARDQQIRCRLFCDLVISYFEENECQDCGKAFAKEAFRNEISFDLKNYEITHQCVFCATKEDNVFEVSDFTIKDGDATYEFMLEGHKLYLKSNEQKLLIYEGEIHEHIPEKPDAYGFRLLVNRYMVHKVVLVKDDNKSHFKGSKHHERILPDNYNTTILHAKKTSSDDSSVKIIETKKFKYFRQTLLRLLHCQPCAKCGQSQALKSMDIDPKEYFVHGWCGSCLRLVVHQKIDLLFDCIFEDNAMIITHKESGIAYCFTVKEGKVYYDDKLVIALKCQKQTIFRCFDETLLQQYLEQLRHHKPDVIEGAIVGDLTDTWQEQYGDWGSFLLQHGTVIKIPDTNIPLEIPPMYNLKEDKETQFELPCGYFFKLLFRRIVAAIPCQQCGTQSKLEDRKSFMSCNHNCYYMDTRCKSCWETLFQ